MTGEPIANRLAAAYSHAKFYCIDTWSGYRLSVLDPQGVSHDCLRKPKRPLGAALSDAVAHSRIFTLEAAEATDIFGFPVISASYRAWVEHLMQIAGLKTRKALFTNLKLCDVVERDGLFVIEPKNHVKLEAWGKLATGPGEITVPSSASPAEGQRSRRADQLAVDDVGELCAMGARG